MSFFEPIPCPTGTTPGGGGGGGNFQFGRDVEGQLLCDVLNGDVVGSAMAIYQYNEETGARIGNPTFIDPVTGNPYVVQGTLQPCGSTDNIDVEEITVCAWYNPLFRGPAIKRTVFIDGVAQPSVFLGDDGATFTPTPPANTAAWFPGDCFWDNEFVVLCDDVGPFLRYFTTRMNNDIWSQRDVELDGSDRGLPTGTVRLCSEASGGTTADRDREVVCWTTTAGGNQIFTGTIRHDDSLPAPGWLLFNQHQTPVNPAEPGLTFVPCGRFLEIEPVCMMVLGERTPGFRREDETGVVTFLGVNGNPVVPGSWTAGPCISDVEHQAFCDQGNNNTTFVRTTRYGVFGEQIGTPDDYTIDGGVYIPTGPVSAGSCTDNFKVLLENGCWQRGSTTGYFSNFPTVRQDWEYSANAGGTYTPNPPSTTDQPVAASPRGTQRYRQTLVIPSSAPTTLDVFFGGDIIDHDNGDPAEVFLDGVSQGTVTGGTPGQTVNLTVVPGTTQILELWIGANNAGTGVTAPFIGASAPPTDFPPQSIEIIKTVNDEGDIVSIRYFSATGVELDPQPDPSSVFLGLCSESDIPQMFWRVHEVLCDDNGPFLRIFRFTQSAYQAPTLLGITDRTLAGAAYTVVGTVVRCATGGGGGAETTQTVRAQHRLLNAGDTWTPGDVTGVLTGVNYTVISGTADVVDQNGTVASGLPTGMSASWQVEEDQNTLQGPQSIQAVGGQTYIVWSER